MIKQLKNKQGLTTVSLMVGIVIAAVFLVITAGVIMKGNKDKEESLIQKNIAQIESAAKSYFSNNSLYPTLANKPLSKFTKGTVHRSFFDVLNKDYNLTEQEIDERIRLADIKTLLTDKYLSAGIDKPEYYVIDSVTGKVYYIKEKATLDELKKLAEQLLKDSNDIIELTVKEGDVFDLAVDGKTMNNVIVSATSGKKVILGGGNKTADKKDIKLAILEIEENPDGTTGKKITDLTPSVRGGALDAPITDLRVLSPNTVLVHYAIGTELEYEVINF